MHLWDPWRNFRELQESVHPAPANFEPRVCSFFLETFGIGTLVNIISLYLHMLLGIETGVALLVVHMY